VLSGGERTRLAVARMLLRPSNTLLLDEPTNHLDLDSKDVLLEALADYGGTLIIVSHDRYFVEKLATKIFEIGHGGATVYPGTYAEFLWSKAQADARASAPSAARGQAPTPKNQPPAAKTETGGGARRPAPTKSDSGGAPPAAAREQTLTREQRKQAETDRRRQQRAREALEKRIADLEGRIAEREARVKELEAAMAAPGFYDDREASKKVIDSHQALMWEVGDLMGQWEALQEHAAEPAAES
jgi:ATP-binding cassette subfamily F protein 3